MRKKISKTSLLSIFFISLSGCESLSPDVPVIPDALSYLGLYSAAPVAHETTSLLNGPLPKDPRLSNKSLARGPIKQIIFYKGCEEHCTENDFKNRYVFDKKNRLIKEETYFSSDYTRTETLSYKDDFKNPSTRENRSSNTGLLSKREYRLDKYGNTVSYIKTDSKGETTTYQAFVKKKGNETILTTTQPHHSAQNNVLHYSNGRLRSIEYEGNLTINLTDGSSPKSKGMVKYSYETYPDGTLYEKTLNRFIDGHNSNTKITRYSKNGLMTLHHDKFKTIETKTAYDEYQVDEHGNWTRRRSCEISDSNKINKCYLEKQDITYF